MKTILYAGVFSALAITVLQRPAWTQNLEEVQVQAKRVLTTKVAGRSTFGAPIVDVTVSYGVSAAGLNLASHSGYEQMQARVTDAAHAACRLISRQFPEAKAKEASCASDAARGAMAEVHRLAHASESSAER